MEKNIVIIGGGFGGLRAALDLARSRAKKMGYRLIVLDKNDSHIYTPLLYEVASGCNDKVISEYNMAKGVTSRLSDYARACGFEFYKGEAVSIDFKNRRVFLKDGSSVDFQALVLAVGSETDFFGIPGLAESALTLKNLEDGFRIRKKIMNLTEEKSKGREVQIRVMIGGGGATGVESAAELAGSFHHLAVEGKIGGGDWTITLVEAGPRILPMLPQEISERARRRLERLGVKVLRDACIKKVNGNRVILAPRPLKEGESPEELLCDFRTETEKEFEADILIWAGGVRANPALGEWGLEVDKKGRVATSPTMEVKGKERENVYAVGDCVFLPDPETGVAAPALAQAAIAEAAVAAKNIIYDLEGLNTRVYYKFRAYPVVVPLGGKNAVAYFWHLHLWGPLGWAVRQAADFRYFLSVLPFRKALKIWFAGALIYSHND
ncbi:FAD-dependent oxidoreductase [Candidatus Uhrbacteria bacterium]|nr:FAD-dependent oxidoreductase [Candidatus Uhrbacteria bacterium]